ncbi:putative ankyrin repeat domain-containing protein 19 [Manis pentadactyla]|uniref:putative ankyrin repeat domain-containing protein 19 n=1 Tax=Manis pentadactyla TaxID=143292 RepID=UPI00255C6E93|nr:putative ankyrin repeat domain-containing protein 19 [Manis pentadactyla]
MAIYKTKTEASEETNTTDNPDLELVASRTAFDLSYEVMEAFAGLDSDPMQSVQAARELRQNCPGLKAQERSRQRGSHDERTALQLAYANSHAEVVTVLVQRKCELNLHDNLERTPLIKAVQCQQEDCACILLNHGADPNVSDIYGNTALHYAACGECVTILTQLLSHNADIKANKEGFTPLLLAIRQRKYEMTKYLLTKGTNVHAVDKKKITTLMLAIDNGSTVIARLLLRQDIDVLSEDTLGWTAENYARNRGLNTFGLSWYHCQ